MNFFDISFSLIIRFYPSWFKRNSEFWRGSRSKSFFLVAEIYMILSILGNAKEVFLLIFFNKVKVGDSPIIVVDRTFILFPAGA